MSEKIGRNDPCPCGSGKKYKNCCFGKPIDKKPMPFKATLLSQPKQIDLMTRTFGEYIEAAEQSKTPPVPPTQPEENKTEEKSS